jgi:hypothetical protein
MSIMIINRRFIQFITQVLLFDKDTPQHVLELGHNSRLVSNCYRCLLSEVLNPKEELPYRVIIAVPKTSSLVTSCEDVCADLKAAGIDAYVARIKDEDMTWERGKVRLLRCIYSFIVGTVLLNEIPISKEQAETILNEVYSFPYSMHHLILLKIGWFQQDYRLGLVRSRDSIGYLLNYYPGYFSENHSVSDIFRAMKAKCHGDDLYIAR